MILRVVQVPTGVQQVALQNWIALHKTLDISFLAARFFFPLFWGPFLDGWTAVIKNLGLHSALFVSLGLFSLEVAGRVLSRTLLDVSCLLAMVVLLLVLTSENDFPAKFLSRSVLLEVDGSLLDSQRLAGAGGDAPLDGASPAVPIDLAGQDHVAGCAGRQGVEQAAPGRRRGFSPPDGGA